MSDPYILVNPKTPAQFAALVKYLKETECPFQVPEDQHFDTSRLCANLDMLDGAIQEGFRTGTLTLEDARDVFGEDVNDYTTVKRAKGITQFKVPKGSRAFWGSEFLDKNGFIFFDCAVTRLTAYCKLHNLLLPYNSGFQTNDELRSVLAVDKATVYFTELATILYEMSLK